MIIGSKHMIFFYSVSLILPMWLLCKFIVCEQLLGFEVLYGHKSVKDMLLLLRHYF
jgi:hypothetical protein